MPTPPSRSASALNPPDHAIAPLRLAAGLLALAPMMLSASGTQVGFKDAFATARGNAFVATADNPSAIYYNPAGLTQLRGQDVSVTAYVARLDADYHSSLTGRTSSLNAETQVLPQLYYAWAPESMHWVVGIGYYAPFGLSTDWSGSSDLFEFATKNKETYTTINPVFAWRLTDTVSIGGGVTFNHLKVDLNRGVLLSGVLPSALFHFAASGNDTGYNLGIRWQPSEQHAFGLSYQARTNFGVSGTSDLNPLIMGEPAHADFAFPEVVIAGYSFRPTAGWNLEANIDWTNWACLKTVTITKASGAVALPFDWKASCFYELGVTHYWTNGWQVSAGYTLSENSVPDATWNPAVPDATRHFWCAGAGYAEGPWRFMCTLQRATAGTRNVRSGQQTLAGSTPDGTYDTSINTFSLSLDYRF
ncbi:MAG TPA: outer membrane protein transport protein [Opitutaceae bacterium]|nr:outer membrane protein transport protein [Opitutaceae bacterium]